MSKPKRVVVIHSGDISMEPVLAGIDEVRRGGHDWYVRHQYNPPRNPAEVSDMLAFEPDGLISVGGNIAAILQQQKFPWVSVRSRQSPLSVVVDEHAVGMCAAEHLVGLGTPVTACLSESDDGWQRHRREGFLAGMARHGREAVVLRWGSQDGGISKHQNFLDQIATLTKPVALFTGNDWFAFEAMEALLGAGVRIPADVALLGADDLARCAASSMPLSSVRVPHRECGRRAAVLLAEAMAGRASAPVTVTLVPDGVAERASTDAVAVRDAEVAQVLRFIRMRVAEPFDVGDVVAASSLGRRTLEMRFRRLLGRSILDEIHRCRIEQAKTMLRTAEVAVAEVAGACGFSDAPHFTVVFRKVTGMTPSAWRAQERRQSAG